MNLARHESAQQLAAAGPAGVGKVGACLARRNAREWADRSPSRRAAPLTRPGTRPAKNASASRSHRRPSRPQRAAHLHRTPWHRPPAQCQGVQVSRIPSGDATRSSRPFGGQPFICAVESILRRSRCVMSAVQLRRPVRQFAGNL
jgi:hypothetical protein